MTTMVVFATFISKSWAASCTRARAPMPKIGAGSYEPYSRRSLFRFNTMLLICLNLIQQLLAPIGTLALDFAAKVLSPSSYPKY